jgi:hypothetical protein
MALIYAGLIGSVVVAWHNVRLGRGDRNGANYVFWLYFASFAGSRFLMARHTPGIDELDVFWAGVMPAALNALVVWVFYLALEPWVRRGWPQTMISWNRFTTKGIRDPLVGRDLLLGIGIGALIALMVLIKFALHAPGNDPYVGYLGALGGVRSTTGTILNLFEGALFEVLFFVFLLFVVRVLLRREWLVAGVFTVLAAAVNTFPTSQLAIDGPFNLLVAAIFTVVMLRLALLAAIVSSAAYEILFSMPRTLDFSSWYAGLGMIPVVLLAGIAIYGFRLSLAGRKLLRSELI